MDARTGPANRTTNKIQTPVLGNATRFGCETKPGYVFWSFFKIDLCSAINHLQGLIESFSLIWLSIGLS